MIKLVMIKLIKVILIYISAKIVLLIAVVSFFVVEFSDSFANKTLAQYPSPIYNPKLSNHGNRPVIGSSSEDSDSGYHSPLHRKNQVTSGTQPMAINPAVIDSNTQHKNDYSKLVAEHSKTEKIPSKQTSAAPKESQSSQQIFSYAFIAQSKPVIESSVKSEEKQGVEGKKSEEKKTEGEESGNEGKRKRKRNRRKRKKKKEENSEEAETVPERNSQVVELYFQDEEEFPDLRVGLDRAGVPERQPSSISYSNIVSQVNQLAISLCIFSNTVNQLLVEAT